MFKISIHRYGYLKVLDERDLVVEVETEEALETLSGALFENFGDHLDLEKI